jgi:hypothetical protein
VRRRETKAAEDSRFPRCDQIFSNRSLARAAAAMPSGP